MPNIEQLPTFDNKIREYSKKYNKKALAKDLIELKKILDKNPDNAISIKENIYKIRLANSFTNKGKSSGWRIYYYYKDNQNNLVLMYIYSKKDKSNLSDIELNKLISELVEKYPHYF